jgi:hypothetical protein
METQTVTIWAAWLNSGAPIATATKAAASSEAMCESGDMGEALSFVIEDGDQTATMWAAWVRTGTQRAATTKAAAIREARRIMTDFLGFLVDRGPRAGAGWADLR